MKLVGLANKKKNVIAIAIVVAGIFMLSAISPRIVAIIRVPRTISELAYDVNKWYGYTVYIEENDGYEPYLVLTGNYNGKILLLRKFLLPKSHVFNNESRPKVAYGAYYGTSSIDEFLSGEFYERLSLEARDKIVDSTIITSSINSFRNYSGVQPTETVKPENQSATTSPHQPTELSRKIFLLSKTELGNKGGSKYDVHGKPLKYFNSAERRIARIADIETGNGSPWWLRSPFAFESTWVGMIAYNGYFASAPVVLEMYIRPAFCVRQGEEIAQRDDIIDGETVYAFK